MKDILALKYSNKIVVKKITGVGPGKKDEKRGSKTN